MFTLRYGVSLHTYIVQENLGRWRFKDHIGRRTAAKQHDLVFKLQALRTSLVYPYDCSL